MTEKLVIRKEGSLGWDPEDQVYRQTFRALLMAVKEAGRRPSQGKIEIAVLPVDSGEHTIEMTWKGW